MPYLLVKTTLATVTIGLFACFAQAEAMPRFTPNEVSSPVLPVGYGYGGYGRGYYGGYGRGYYGGYGRGYYSGGYGPGYYGGGYGRGYYGGYGRGYYGGGGYGGGYSHGCGDYY